MWLLCAEYWINQCSRHGKSQYQTYCKSITLIPKFHIDWYTVLSTPYMPLWVQHSTFWDWQVNFSLPYLKYSYTFYTIFRFNKSVIIINSCVVKACFTLQVCKMGLSNCQGHNYVFHIVFCIWMTSSGIHICTLKQHSMSTCR